MPAVKMKVAALLRTTSVLSSLSQTSRPMPEPRLPFRSEWRGGCIRGFLWALLLEVTTTACVAGAIFAWRAAHF